MKRFVMVLFVGFLSISFPVHAQESATPSAEPTDSPTPGTAVTFEQLRTDYLYQIELYREAQDRFTLDKAEFNKLKTLASREKAVESMRPFLKQRAMVVKTYLIALEFLLQDAQGIDVDTRRQALEQSQSIRTWIADYINSVDTAQDREAVNLISQEFEAKSIRIFESQYRMLSLLAIARMQVVYDQLENVTEEFRDKYVTNVPQESLKAALERGLTDVEFQNDKASSGLEEANTALFRILSDEELDEMRRKPEYKDMYTNVLEKLQGSFSAIKQSLRFLSELERQV